MALEVQKFRRDDFKIVCFKVGVTLLALSSCLPVFADAPSRQKLQDLLSLGEQSQISKDMHRAEIEYLAATSEAAKFGSKSPELQESEARLASIYVLQGKLALAEPHYLKTREIALELRRSNKENPEGLVLLDDLSDAYELQGSTKEAEFCYLHCLNLRQAISPKHKNLPNAQVLYGAHLIAHGKLVEGEEYFRDGHALSASIFGAESPNTAKLDLTIANMYNSVDKIQEAEKYCGECESIFKKCLSPPNEMVANVTRLHAVILSKMGRLKEAEKEVKAALEIHTKIDGVESVEYAYDLSCLARIYMDSRRLADAETAVSKSLAIMKKHSETLTRIRKTTLELGVKIAHLQHHDAQAAKLESELKTIEGKH
jgi:tetratricopeptide (TPR) repeat protein